MTTPRVVDLTGGAVLDPTDHGTTKKWKFKNSTGEPIFDFYLATGPRSFLEIEWPWGESGNPPDIRKFTIREDGFEDASKEFDDVVEGKATLDPPIDPGKEFELEFEFDDPFEPVEYLEIVPTDRNGATIENADETETAEPNTGTGELLKGIGTILQGVSQLNLKTEDVKTALRFEKESQKYVLSFVREKPPRRPIQVVHLERKRIAQKATYGLRSGGKRGTKR